MIESERKKRKQQQRMGAKGCGTVIASGFRVSGGGSQVGTGVKYARMASRKRRMYQTGEMMVGTLPAPPRSPELFTQVSSCLSHVY